MEADKTISIGNGRNCGINSLDCPSVLVLSLEDGGAGNFGGFHSGNLLKQIFQLSSSHFLGKVLDIDVLLQVGEESVGSDEVSVEGESTAIPLLVNAVGDFEVLQLFGDLLEVILVDLNDTHDEGRGKTGHRVRTARSELNGLLKLNTAPLLDDLVDSDGCHDLIGEVIQVEALSLVNNRCHFLFV